MYEYRVAYTLKKTTKKDEGPVEFMTGVIPEGQDPAQWLADYRHKKNCIDARLQRREVGDWEQVEVTKTGKILDQADFDALADEAERDYDVERMQEHRRQTHPHG